MIIEINDPVFGKNIRFLRNQYQLSQTALARLTGISVEHLRWVEHGNDSARFTVYNMSRLSEVLNVSVEHLTGTDLEREIIVPYIRNYD